MGERERFSSSLFRLAETAIMSMASMRRALTSSCEISSTVSLLGKKSNLMSCRSFFSSRMRRTKCTGVASRSPVFDDDDCCVSEPEDVPVDVLLLLLLLFPASWPSSPPPPALVPSSEPASCAAVASLAWFDCCCCCWSSSSSLVGGLFSLSLVFATAGDGVAGGMSSRSKPHSPSARLFQRPDVAMDGTGRRVFTFMLRASAGSARLRAM